MIYFSKIKFVEAVRYVTGAEAPAIEFLGGYSESDKNQYGQYETNVARFTPCGPTQSVSITLITPNVDVKVHNGDYIVKSPNGMFYVSRAEEFESEYEALTQGVAP